MVSDQTTVQKMPLPKRCLLYTSSRMVRPDLNATAEARVKGLLGLRDCVQELIYLQMDAAVPDSTIPVSYTHLDVYKRQGPACAMFLIFPTPEPVNIPALPGCGSWRSARCV